MELIEEKIRNAPKLAPIYLPVLQSGQCGRRGQRGTHGKGERISSFFFFGSSDDSAPSLGPRLLHS